MEFKDIKGWEDKYEISDTGIVISKARTRKGKRGCDLRMPRREMKHNNNHNGYATIALCQNSKTKRSFVHRLVYETFVTEIPAGMQINHINGIKTDNRISNLELTTPLENTRHAWRTGLSKKRLGEKCSTSKLTEENVKTIRQLAQTGSQQIDIAKQFKVHYTNIHYILIGKTWSHVT